MADLLTAIKNNNFDQVVALVTSGADMYIRDGIVGHYYILQFAYLTYQ